MENTDLATRIWSLADLPRGVSARVHAIGPAHRADLAGLGIHRGTLLQVESDCLLGDPRVIRLARRRLAVGRAAARTIEVTIEPDPGGDVA